MTPAQAFEKIVKDGEFTDADGCRWYFEKGCLTCRSRWELTRYFAFKKPRR